MDNSYSSGFQHIIKAIGILFFGLFALFIPDVGPFLFLLSLFFVIRTLYQAWLLSEREFAVTNRDNVPNIIFDPKKSIVRGYEDEDEK